jgi:rhodanese-related sulfurtransferase
MFCKLHEVDPVLVKEWLDQNKALLIDVRELDEYQDESINGSLSFPTSTLQISTLPHDKAKKIVFHCKGGRRSANAAQKWANFFGEGEAYHMKGGIEAWINSGLPTSI